MKPQHSVSNCDHKQAVLSRKLSFKSTAAVDSTTFYTEMCKHRLKSMAWEKKRENI